MNLALVDDNGEHTVVIENVEQCDFSLASPYKLANIGVAVGRKLQQIQRLQDAADKESKGG